MVERHEPLTFAQGDTLCFHKRLPDYLPSDGWQLLYEIRGPQLPNAAIQFQSTPDATNTVHEINVAENVTVNWIPGDSVLVGYAVNAGLGQRHQIYYGELILTSNLGTAQNNVDTRTHAQKMIENLECALLELSKHSINDSNIQQVEIRRAKREELRTELAYWKEVRENEIAIENVANGKPSGNKIKPVFNVIGSGPSVGNAPSWPFAQP